MKSRNVYLIAGPNGSRKILCSRCKKFFISKEALSHITVAFEICKTCLRKIRKRNSKKIASMSISERAETALKQAVQGVIKEHARLGLPVVIWRNGKVAKAPANQLLRKRA